MSYLKRLSVSLRSQVEQLVSQVEDHEAVVDAAIADARKTLASAKVRIQRVAKDGEKLQQQITECQHARDKWRKRAKQSASQDESTALECLQRSQQAEQRLVELERIHAAHSQQQNQLQQIVESAEQQLQEKIQRRNLMSTRESALATTQPLTSSSYEEKQDWELAFDRWEQHITEMEINQDLDVSIDTLEAQFSSKERLDELKADLHELLEEENGHES